MGVDKDDGPGAHWPWNDAAFEKMRADHERFMAEHNARVKTTDMPSSDPVSSSNSPFAAFKSFVDSNLNSFTSHFRNFPSNIAEIKARMQREQEWRHQEEQDFSERWTGSEDSPDHISVQKSRMTQEEKDSAHTAVVQLLSEAYERSIDIPAEKIAQLYDDPEHEWGMLDRLISPMLALGGAWYLTPEVGDKLPTPSDWRPTIPNPRWLSVDWFKYSPYSPIRMEMHTDLQAAGSKWRAAFEDLINASLDKPMAAPDTQQFGYRPPFGKLQSSLTGPGLDWMLSLQCRGILPPMLPQFISDCRRAGREPLPTLLSSFPWAVQDVPWSGERAYRKATVLQREVSDLLSEIATKSTGDTPAELEAQAIDTIRQAQIISESLDQTPASCPFMTDITIPKIATSTPDTELDLYEHFHDLTDGRRSSLVAQWLRDDSLKFNDADNAIRINKLISMAVEAEDLGDVEAMTTLVNAWRESLGQSHGHPLSTAEIMSTGLMSLLTDNGATCQTDSDSGYDDDEDDEDHEIDDDHTDGQTPVHAPQPPPTTKIAATARPDVLSALTTTQTTRMPDGTVTTKVVLKQRFADGREETTETVHTTNERLEQKHGGVQTEAPATKSKGWFWS